MEGRWTFSNHCNVVCLVVSQGLKKPYVPKTLDNLFIRRPKYNHMNFIMYNTSSMARLAEVEHTSAYESVISLPLG